MKLVTSSLACLAFLAGASSSAWSQISQFCFGDGSSGACPCGNFSAPSTGGCVNSLGSPGVLTAFAMGALPDVSDDISGANRITLQGSGMPNALCIYFQGSPVPGTAFGDGIRCVNNPFQVQLKQVINVGGTSFAGGTPGPAISLQGFVNTPLPAPCTRAYQCFYRNTAAFCTPATWNMTNGVMITWVP